MPSLVLTPRLTTDSLHLEKAARQLGWPVHRARRYQVPHDIEDPIVYGEVTFCDVMAEMLGLGLLEPSDNWLAELPSQYLLREVRALAHEDLRVVRGRHFIKPANDKVFEAGIFECGAHVPYRRIDPEAPVLVSEVVDFETEIRCYVLDRRLLTAGVYAGKAADAICREGTSGPEVLGGLAGAARTEAVLYDEGWRWMESFLADDQVDMPSAVVIDVGFIEGRGWAIVEANQGYCSGVYTEGYATATSSPGADPKKVLEVIARSGGLRTNVGPDDRKWLRP